MKLTLLLLLLISPLIHAEPAFVGTISTREQGSLFIIIPSPEALPRWVKVGDTVDGYSVVSFKAKDEVLILKKDARTYSLKLKEAKVRSGASAVSESALIEASAKIVARMDNWTSDMSYQVAIAQDGYWHVFVTKDVDGKKEVRRVRLTPEGKATNWSKMILQEKS